MDRGFREQQLARLHPEVAANTALRSIARELTLEEIAIMTRAAPARLLGLTDRGHLGVGAAADIAVYRENPDREAMFRTPEYVFKDGALVARAGRVMATPVGGTHFIEPGYDSAIERTLRRHWDAHGSIGFDHVAIDRDELCRCGNGGAPAAGCRASSGTVMSASLQLNGVVIDDTFAEAFADEGQRASSSPRTRWPGRAAPREAATGFATSVIGCGCEAGIEREMAPHETPDGRPGVAVLLFAMSGKELAKQIERRVGQCVLTCPTTAVFAGIAEGEAVALGKNLRFFGDGWQISKVIGGVRYWRVPVMDGEFVAQETTAVVKGVGGGNLLLLARDTDAALGRGRGGGGGDARAAQRDHAVPGRRRALGLEGGQQVSDAQRIDQRCVLPRRCMA